MVLGGTRSSLCVRPFMVMYLPGDDTYVYTVDGDVNLSVLCTVSGACDGIAGAWVRQIQEIAISCHFVPSQ